MSKTLPRNVIQAINALANTPLGQKYDRMARQKYGISGKKLAAKEVVGESGGRRGAVSSAGARGYTQFIPPTRQEYLQRYGVDAWAGPRQAIKAMELYQTHGGGIESYNPGMPTYASYILGQKLGRSTRAQLKLGARGGTGPVNIQGPGRVNVSLPTKTIPGVDNSAARDALRQQLLLSPGGLTMDKLLAFKQQEDDLQDVPSRKEYGPIKVTRSGGRNIRIPGSPGSGSGTAGGGNKVLPHTHHTLNEMFRIAQDVDKINNRGKLPYEWGGGHGARPAKVGQRVDCSGFVSQILGVAPRVSGQFQSSWGVPGRGKWVTVYATPEHVLIAMRDPRSRRVRWFATSRSNPGGGAGEISKPSPAYLSQFTARHPG